MSNEPAEPQFHPGGAVKGPGGSDTVPVLIDLRYERIFTAEHVKRLLAAGMTWDEEKLDWVPDPAVWGGDA